MPQHTAIALIAQLLQHVQCASDDVLIALCADCRTLVPPPSRPSRLYLPVHCCTTTPLGDNNIPQSTGINARALETGSWE